MNLSARELCREEVPFVYHVYEQNRAVLHGEAISLEAWRDCVFGEEADPHEAHFIIVDGGSPAAWLKLNALNEPDIWISMLVVDRELQHQGIGRFAIRFAEQYAKDHGKRAVCVQTTKENAAAIALYLSCGYKKAPRTQSHQKFQKLL